MIKKNETRVDKRCHSQIWNCIPASIHEMSSLVRTPIYRSLLVAVAAVLVSPHTLARTLDLGRVVAFDIPAQPIESALVSFSKQAKIQVVIAQDADGTALAPGVHAILSARDALDILVKSSDLSYVTVGDSVSISRNPSHHPITLDNETTATSTASVLVDGTEPSPSQTSAKDVPRSKDL